MSKWQREYALDWFRRNCEPHEIVHMEAAFDGDTKAAKSLSICLDNDVRGIMAVAMWEGKAPRAAFRAYLSSAWDHDHRRVIDAAKTRRQLAYMFRYAAFALPDELPEMVRVWRGTSKLNFAEAGKGYSWSTDRDVACWFAMRFADGFGSPLLLVADVPKSEIVFFHDGRGESEALLLKPPKASVDGDEGDWQAGSARNAEKIKLSSLLAAAAA